MSNYKTDYVHPKPAIAAATVAQNCHHFIQPDLTQLYEELKRMNTDNLQAELRVHQLQSSMHRDYVRRCEFIDSEPISSADIVAQCKLELRQARIDVPRCADLR